TGDRRNAGIDQRRSCRILEHPTPGSQRVVDVDRLSRWRRHRRTVDEGIARLPWLALGLLSPCPLYNPSDSGRVLPFYGIHYMAYTKATRGSAVESQSHPPTDGTPGNRRPPCIDPRGKTPIHCRHFQAGPCSPYRTGNVRLLLSHHNVLFHSEMGS